jgi:hypothetical protein
MYMPKKRSTRKRNKRKRSTRRGGAGATYVPDPDKFQKYSKEYIKLL